MITKDAADEVERIYQRKNGIRKKSRIIKENGMETAGGSSGLVAEATDSDTVEVPSGHAGMGKDREPGQHHLAESRLVKIRTTRLSRTKQQRNNQQQQTALIEEQRWSNR